MAQTLRSKVKNQGIDASECEGVTSAEAQSIKDLERELRKANEILKLLASAFSARRSSTAASSPEGFRRPASSAIRGRVDLSLHVDRPAPVLAPCGPSARPGAVLASRAARCEPGAASSARLAGHQYLSISRIT